MTLGSNKSVNERHACHLQLKSQGQPFLLISCWLLWSLCKESNSEDERKLFQTQARWMSGSKGKKTFIKLSDYFIRLILRGEKCLRLAIYGSMCHIWKALCGWAEALGHKRNGFVFPDSRNFVWNMVLITAHLLYETHKAIWLKRSLKVISGEANNTIFHLVLCAVWILRSCFVLTLLK